MPVPANIFLYRLIHKDNLEHILSTQKLVCPNHPERSQNYRSIGETELIRLRSTRSLPISPGGSFRNYVSFYLGPRPVMLYAIKNGFNVERLPQEEIIYLISTFERVQTHRCQFVFSDGHGYAAFTGWYNKPEDFKEVDWSVVNSNRWNDTDDDPDRKRRKQAEFLIHHEISISIIERISVFNQKSLNFVNNLMIRYSKNRSILTDINTSLYY
ncbi:MAG: DUF4433 domain-containing protein [Bacteroidales bacterium]|nr:DUF4433 domain-containing protein [Bacteroidales bacterium]